MVKIEELKVKISSNADIKVRMSYLAIYEVLVNKYSKDELSLYWKDFESAKASLYYHRRKKNPSLPKTVNEIVISGDYTQTSDNKPFLSINVKQIMADFEAAWVNQLKTTFFMAIIKGCWFHFNQAIIRKLFNLGE